MPALDGQRVAFTGRLASMTRPEAADLVRAHGGRYVASVTQTTSLLVVGQEGWPLRAEGQPSQPLQKAKRLQAAGKPLVILTEEEFFARLGLEGASKGVHRTFSLAQLIRLVKVPRDRLRSWIQAGLIEPVKTDQGVRYFDFAQVTAVRTLWDLTRAGVTPDAIRRGLDQLKRWVPALDPWKIMPRFLESDGQLLLRLGDGQLVDATGQQHFDFDRAETPDVLPTTPPQPDFEDLWTRGCDAEKSGDFAEAARCYRESLYLGGPQADLCFNLGNVLCSLGEHAAAVERFRQALEMDNAYVAAWNNLGAVFAAMGKTREAIAAFRQSLALDPHFADAHFNLADTLQAAGRAAEACEHWRAFLRLGGSSEEWTAYARSRLFGAS